jgi:ABC-type multidrug transport system fused ATPase/permease subunit
LLDEPTAALDPIAEYKIYMQFNEMTADKSAVLITHRLSAVQLADKVAVFNKGELIEYGTHRQLYEKTVYTLICLTNNQNFTAKSKYGKILKRRGHAITYGQH